MKARSLLFEEIDNYRLVEYCWGGMRVVLNIVKERGSTSRKYKEQYLFLKEKENVF